MELAVAQENPNKSVYTVTDRKKTWFLVTDILKGYDDYSIKALFDRVGRRRKKHIDGHMYVDEQGVKILCHYITGELNSAYEQQIIGKPAIEDKPVTTKVSVDTQPIVKKPLDTSFELAILKRKVKDLQKKVDYLMALFSGVPLEEEKPKIKENTLVDEILKEPHVEPQASYWSAWCCTMINKLFYAMKDSGHNINMKDFYILIYKQLESKYGINLYKLRKDKKVKSYIKIIESNKDWRQYLTGIILKQAELAGVTVTATFKNGEPIPMVNVP